MRAPGIYALHTDFFDLIDRGAVVTKVADGFGFTEGPVFSRIGFLLFSDLRSEKIYKYSIPAWKSEPKTAGEMRDQSKRVQASRALRMSRLRSANPRRSANRSPLT